MSLDAAHAKASDAILERLLTLHPKLMDLSLGRMRRMLARLGNPERSLPPVVHIAGTNGKGSTLAMIRAGLEARGDVAHAYTSPHLAWFHERVRLAGRLIGEDALAAVLEECERENAGEPITFFEITTAAAFVAFARAPADWTLLEVGLGGRLDATNVVDRPRLTAITPISFDHEQWLGDTLGKIAFEKAGILKPGVACVVGSQHPEALATIEARAVEIGAPLIRADREWTAAAEGGRLVFEDRAGLLDLPLPALRGAHQIENAGTAIAALRELGADEAACAAAMERAEWPARLQRLREGPLADVARAAEVELWLDGGHNVAAGAAIARWLADQGDRAPAPTRLVCGMLDTKDPVAFLQWFEGLAGGVHAVAIPDSQASLTADALAAAAARASLSAVAEPSIGEAVARACAGAGPEGRVLICGSLYLAGAVLRGNG